VLPGLAVLAVAATFSVSDPVTSPVDAVAPSAPATSPATSPARDPARDDAVAAQQRRARSERLERRAARAKGGALAVEETPAHAAAYTTTVGTRAAAPAAQAVGYALAQVGDAYVWGATGTDAWDCSGLVVGSYGRAGVALARTSAVQAETAGALVHTGADPDPAQLVAGDLVFFYHPVSHAGMYVGLRDGVPSIVHAANPGQGVVVTALSDLADDVAAVRRPADAVTAPTTLGALPDAWEAVADDGATVRLDRTQVGFAATIARVGYERALAAGLGEADADRAVATAFQTVLTESGFRNDASVVYEETLGQEYPAGAVGSDHDSVGLFQQRPQAGWGAPTQVLDPAYAAAAFFGGPDGPNAGSPRGLLDVAGWLGMSPGEAAQAVQGSAYPGRYAHWQAAAEALLAAVKPAVWPAVASGDAAPVVLPDPVAIDDEGAPEVEPPAVDEPRADPVEEAQPAEPRAHGKATQDQVVLTPEPAAEVHAPLP